MNISLPDEMKAFVEAQVATGRYANASDYMRDLIRHDLRESDLVAAALEEGEASGISPRSLDDIFEELTGKKR